MDLWQSVLAGATTRVEDLVTQGEVHVDERNDLGETALHLACSYGLDDVAIVLLAHGADVALQDWESGWTPLHRSVYHAHLSTSLLLLRHARQAHGRQFMKTLLYDTKDFAHESAMHLVSSYQEKHKPSIYEIYHFDNDENEEKPKFDEENEEKENKLSQPRPQRGGMVYTFGKVDFQLGYHLPHVNVQSSPRLVELPITAMIVQISASKFHTIALNDRGQLYVWGFGKGGRLGTGTEFDHVEPTLLTSLHGIPMVQVAAGENHTLALSHTGQVFSWGSNSFGQLGHTLKSSTQESRITPKRIDAFKGMFMTAIAASGVHSGAICRDYGFVYTWGSNKRGQLGRKDGFGIDQPNPTPRRVDRLVPGHALSVLYEPHDAVRAVQLAMSDVHTCVILRSRHNGQSHGYVWQFGYGSNIPTRLLFKAKRRTTSQSLMLQDTWLPRWKLRSDDIVAVACAPNHSIALSACGSVYTWGHNGDALSHQKTDYIPPGTPQRVRLDQYGPIVHICASQNHCVVVTQAGDLVSWGCGPQGVLGHGPGNSWQPSPKQVYGTKKVVAVAAGHQHTVVLVAPRLPRQPVEKREPGNLESPPKLRHLLETKIATYLDLSNVATVWKYANVYSQRTLEQYCVEYMRLNWDALLEMGSKDRLDTLFDLMLAPFPKSISRRVGFVSSEEKSVKVKTIGDRKSERKASISLDEKKPETAAVLAVVVSSVPLAMPSPVLKPQAVVATARRVKGAKFVSVDSFFSEKKEESKAFVPPLPVTEPRSILSPWAAATPPAASAGSYPPATPTMPLKPAAFPKLGDHIRTRLPRKESMDRVPLSSSAPRKSPTLSAGPSPQLSFAPSVLEEPRKQVLCYDGSTRAPASAFTLDAFIKKSTRKKSRSDSIDMAKPATTWGALPSASNTPSTPAMPVTRKKSLQEIQDEEQALARSEAAAKARNGGFLRKASSINSWGLVQQQSHISFEALQQCEEEERIVEEQRQILAQIEREKRQREADEKRRLAKQQTAKQGPSQSQSQSQGKNRNKENKNKDKNQQPKPKKTETEKREIDGKNNTKTTGSVRRSKAKQDLNPEQKPAESSRKENDGANPQPKKKKPTKPKAPPQPR